MTQERYDPEETSAIQQAAYFGMLLMPAHFLKVAEHTTPENFKEYVCEFVSNIQSLDQVPALRRVAEAESVRIYVDMFLDTIASSVPEELIRSLRHSDLSIRLLAARRRYIDSMGKDQEAYALVKELLDAGPPMSDEDRVEYLDRLDHEAVDGAVDN